MCRKDAKRFQFDQIVLTSRPLEFYVPILNWCGFDLIIVGKLKREPEEEKFSDTNRLKTTYDITSIE